MQSRSIKDEIIYKEYKRVFHKLVTEAEESYYRKLFDAKTNTVELRYNGLGYNVLSDVVPTIFNGELYGYSVLGYNVFSVITYAISGPQRVNGLGYNVH